MKHSKNDVPVEENLNESGVPEKQQACGMGFCPETEGADTACECGASEEASAEETLAEDPEMAKLAEDLLKTQEELMKTKEAYLRSVAEFDNYRRRNNEEKPKLANYAKGDLAKDLFPILDNFKIGLTAAEQQHPEAKSITEGFAMIANQLKKALEQHNIVEFDPVGEPFNPNEHESLTSQPSEEIPEDHVVLVHRTGYKIGDRLLRPAAVVISAGKN